MHKTIDICRTELFTAEEELRKQFPAVQVDHLLRIREMYNWFMSNPDAKDRQFIEQHSARFNLRKTAAYQDLAIVKALLPQLSSASRDFHRYRFNEMILETYHMAKARKDTKTMEKAASSYARYNRIDVEDEQSMPFDLIVVQPFTATSDPSVLGIKPLPNLQEHIDQLLRKYGAESADIEDIEYEEADIEEEQLFGNNQTINP